MIGITTDGIVCGRLGRRLPEAERWDQTGWQDLKGVPWDLRPTGVPALEIDHLATIIWQMTKRKENCQGMGPKNPRRNSQEMGPRTFEGEEHTQPQGDKRAWTGHVWVSRSSFWTKAIGEKETVALKLKQSAKETVEVAKEVEVKPKKKPKAGEAATLERQAVVGRGCEQQRSSSTGGRKGTSRGKRGSMLWLAPFRKGGRPQSKEEWRISTCLEHFQWMWRWLTRMVFCPAAKRSKQITRSWKNEFGSIRSPARLELSLWIQTLTISCTMSVSLQFERSPVCTWILPARCLRWNVWTHTRSSKLHVRMCKKSGSRWMSLLTWQPVSEFRHLDSSTTTNGQNHGPVWKTQSFLLGGICTVFLWQDYCGKGNVRKSYWKMAGRKFQIGNVSLFIVKKDYSYLCMWMT